MTDTPLQYYGNVTPDGTLKLPGAKIRSEVMVFAGKEIEVLFRLKKKHRSDPQNRYYWGVVVEMIRAGMKEMGDTVTPDQVHEFLKWRFLKEQRIDETTGEVLYEYAGSTAKLKTAEFGEYIEKCCQFAAEMLGVSIPLPR
jgi:hypothetical protein